jgi:hypothetical protein
MTKYKQLTLIAALALTVFTTPAFADHDRYWRDNNGVWHDRYDDNSGWQEHYDGDGDRDGRGGWRDRDDNDRWGDRDHRVAISDRDRAYLSRVLRTNFFRDCPRTKRNVCLPPRFSPKQYEIGRRLPRGVEYGIPSSLRVSPPPGNYQYIKVGDDLVLINKETKKVLDAVTLRSALRN